MCSTDVCCSKTNRQHLLKRITHHFFISGIQAESTDAAKICGGAENVKTKQQTFVNGLLDFYYFRHLYSAGSACVLLTIIAWICPSIWAALSTLLINILLGSFQLFSHSDDRLSWGWSNPLTLSASRGAALSTPEAVVAAWLTDNFDNATDDDQRQHHHAEHHFQL